VLAAAGNINSISAVASIGSPADPTHILHIFDEHLEEIQLNGSADVTLAGRKFTVSQKFVDDVRSYNYTQHLNQLEGHKLIMHSPTDSVVELKNAGEIYTKLKCPPPSSH
jgi:putative redox protein